MDILQLYKTYLLTSKNPPTKVTVKNYLADVRKFINWYEMYYQKNFLPAALNAVIIEAYRKFLFGNLTTSTGNSTSMSSYKRYMAGLKNFSRFLQHKGFVTSDPFPEEKPQTITYDPWLLKEFKNYLHSCRMSNHSIKNYINDLHQFIHWFRTVHQLPENYSDRNILRSLDNALLTEYKNRLYQDAHYSPFSVNRKLSSLRKYITWLGSKHLVHTSLSLGNIPILTGLKIADEDPQVPNIADLKTLIDTHPPEPPEIKHNVPGFGPARLALLLITAMNSGIDLLIVNPLTDLILFAYYILWKTSGKKVFQPLQDFIGKKSTNKKTTDVSFVTQLPKTSRDTDDTAAQPFFMERLVTREETKPPRAIHNLSKSLYAPLHSALHKLPWYKRLLFHLKYTRPAWYKSYHRYAIVHYIHFALLLVAVIVAGISIYKVFMTGSPGQNPALAELAAAPPRTVAFQGKLTDAQNSPITATTSLRFGIYNDAIATGSALLWQEVQTVTPDHNGFFSVTLGRTNPIPATVFLENPELYIGITIGTNSELQPRQQIATVNYAANTQTVQGLKPITQPNAGTTNVLLALDSSGNLTIGGSASPTFEASGGYFTLSGQAVTLTTDADSNGSIHIAPDGSGIIDLQKPLQNTTNNNNIASARGAVEVDDLFAVLATSSGQSAFTINQNSTGPLISASTGGIAKFSVDALGSGMFAGNLGINGNNLTTTATSFNLLPTNVINLNIGNTASALSIGSNTGITTINNTLSVAKLANLNGGVLIPAEQTVSINGFIGSNMIPLLNDVYDLGSATNHWHTAYVNNLVIGNASSSAALQIFGSAGFYTSTDAGAGTTPALFIAQDGVGIGTANPGAGLDVESQAETNPFAIFNGTTSATGVTINNNGSGNLFSVANNSNNKFIITASGNVGIGNPLPAFKLDVSDSQAATAAAQIYNSNSSTDADGLIVKLGNTSTTVASSNHFIDFETAGIGSVGSIQGNGAKGISFVQNGVADFAEYFKKDQNESITFGAVVCLTQNGTVVPCDGTTTAIVGVTSAHPAFLGGENLGDRSIPVGLTGLVQTTVSSANGPIKPGDVITASSLAGVGVKAIRPGVIVGRAIEGYDNTDPHAVGSILVSVHVGWFAPDNQLTTGGNLQGVALATTSQTGQQNQFLSALSQTLQTIQADIVTAQKMTTDSLAVTSENITIGGQTLKHYIASIVSQTISNTQNDIVKNSLIGPVASVASLHTTLISPLADTSAISMSLQDTKLTIHASNSASSAAVAVLDNQGNASFSGTVAAKNLQTHDATISGTLYANHIAANQIDGLDAKLATLAAALHQNTSPESLSFQGRGQGEGATTPASSQAALLLASQSAHPASDSSLLANNQTPTTNSIHINNSIGTTDYVNPASLSAQLAAVPAFKTDFATVNQGLMVFGSTSLADVSVAGQLSINGSFILTRNTLNTLGSDLQLQSLRQGNLSIMAGLVNIDTNGNLSVSGDATFARNVTVKGTLAAHIISPLASSDMVIKLPQSKQTPQTRSQTPGSKFIIRNASDSGVLTINQLGDIIASGSGAFSTIATQGIAIIRGAQADTSITETIASGSAGTAVITPYETQRTIITPFVKANSLIYITPTSDTKGLTPYISRQTPQDQDAHTKGSFTIAIPKPVTAPITLNWWIVN